MRRSVVLAPDLLWDGARFREGWAVRYDPSTGRIEAVGPETEVSGPREEAAGLEPPGGPGGDARGGGAGGRNPRGEAGPPGRSEGTLPGPTVERLPGRALLPGFVNAHSHAFQRLIRGRTQWKPADAPEADFWSWREAMYEAAAALGPEDVFAASRWCFLEMLRAGYTTVGEFHYLQRDPEGRPYDDPCELALRVVAAARDVGIRITLLNACYATGGIEEPLGPRQRRFATPDPDAYTRDTEALRAALAEDPLATVGAAPHSVRAVPRDWMRPLGAWARDRGMPLHMHVSEQPREVTACREAYGLSPVALAAEEGLLEGRFTGVHATHVTAEEIGLLAEAGASVCFCPTTERDLGDGIPPASELCTAGVDFAFGSDSNTVIDPFEEMRLVEYHERLRTLGRVVLADDASEGRSESAPALLALSTVGGGRSLGLAVGRLDADSPADMAAVDLGHRALAGWTPGTLDACLVFSGSADVVTDVWVAGVRRVRDRRHAREPDARAAFDALARRLPRGT